MFPDVKKKKEKKGPITWHSGGGEKRVKIFKKALKKGVNKTAGHPQCEIIWSNPTPLTPTPIIIRFWGWIVVPSNTPPPPSPPPKHFPGQIFSNINKNWTLYTHQLPHLQPSLKGKTQICRNSQSMFKWFHKKSFWSRMDNVPTILTKLSEVLCWNWKFSVVFLKFNEVK